jgi:putative salt-induced outer membrane protein YdiY
LQGENVPNPPLTVLVAAGALAAAATSALADEVVLRNGDRLSGTVLHLADGKLSLRTPYAEKLELDWRDVAAVSTDAPVTVLRRGDTQPQAVRLGPDVSLADVLYLNPQPDESGLGTTYTGRGALAASYVRGNAQSERFYADGELTGRAKPHRFTLSGKTERRADPLLGKSVAWLASGNYDRFVGARRFVYGRASLEHDRLKDIDRRSALGAGYGTQLLDTERASVSLRGGLDYVVVERSVAADERYPALGWAFKADASPPGSRLRIFHEHEGFWDLHQSTRLFVRSKTGVRMPLVARLSVTAQLNVDWERRPAPGRKATDTTLLVGLDYSW